MPPAPEFSTMEVGDELSPVLDRLFSAESHHFEFGGRRGNRDWFHWGTPGDAALSARAAILDAAPGLSLYASADADALISEFCAQFAPIPSELRGHAGLPLLRSISVRWPHDVLLLRRDHRGEHTLAAYAVCFPSSWRPEEKIGLGIEAVHAPVPGLNAQLGGKIRTFLTRLPPGRTFERDNWGLAATPEPNLHPSRCVGALPADARADGVWLRIEHQAFRALPVTGGLVFAIGLTILPIREVVTTPDRKAGFLRILRTMSSDVAAYKGIAAGRDSLIASLG